MRFDGETERWRLVGNERALAAFMDLGRPADAVEQAAQIVSALAGRHPRPAPLLGAAKAALDRLSVTASTGELRQEFEFLALLKPDRVE